MLKKTITYTDFDGNERTEDFYFHLTDAELMDLELSVSGGFSNMVEKIQQTQDIPKIIEIFKKLIHLSYGVKSPDGRKFMKSKEILDDFLATEAYSQLYMELGTNDEKAAEFINGVVPNKTGMTTDELLNKVKAENPALAPVNN